MIFLKLKKTTVILLGVALVLQIIFSDITKTGVARGLLICANVIIPSLFPFMICVTLLIKLGFEIKNKYFNRILYKMFGHNFDMFFAFLLSMIGGYPIGAKMINELYKKEILNNKSADLMLNYCVNAGPAFIVCVVGNTLHSKELGYVLLISHLLSSVAIAVLHSFKLRQSDSTKIKRKNAALSFSNSFVESVNDATKNILNICGFIIIFSILNAYIDYFFKDLTFINYIMGFVEITTALENIKNVYLLSFLLGFAGVSIWCQIFSLSGGRKVNIGRFIVGRLLHGGISAIITKIILGFFKIKISTFSNKINYVKEYSSSNVALLISMGIMLVIFMIFLYTKNNSGKIIDDVI